MLKYIIGYFVIVYICKFLKFIFRDNHSSSSLPIKENESISEEKIKDQVNDLIHYWCRDFRFIETRQDTNSLTLIHSIVLHGEDCILKTVVLLDSGHLSSTLWNIDESEYIQVIAVGYLSSDLAGLRFVGTQRFKPLLTRQGWEKHMNEAA
jgi:hypothetical protein